MAGEQIVTLSASGATDVKIWTTKLDHNYDKPVINFQMPNLKDGMKAETEPITKIVDIGRVKEAIAVQGYLVDDATSLAKTKKENLAKLIKFHRTVTITWGTTNQQTASGDILKVMVTETPGLIFGGTPPTAPDEKNYAVQLSLIVGTDSMS